MFITRAINFHFIFQKHRSVITLFATMACQNKKQFSGKEDRYNGITVDSTVEPCNASEFADKLQASLTQWINDKRKTIWFQVDLSQTHWVPILTSNGFKFHHAKEEKVTLYRWLKESEICNVPPYSHTSLGVGGVVLKEDTNEILVVREQHGLSTHWKLPGGYVEPGEDISKAAEREVFEETGVKAKFKCLLAFRHGHEYIFGCSDIYMISCLVPETFEIRKCSREISECQWMKLEEFISHPNVHKNNRSLAQRVLEYLNHKTGIFMTTEIHPLTKKPIHIFSISKACDVSVE